MPGSHFQPLAENGRAIENRNMKKSVLITGCSSGIGKCAVEYLQKRQWHVYATARKENDVQSLRDSGFSAYRLDLTEEPILI